MNSSCDTYVTECVSDSNGFTLREELLFLHFLHLLLSSPDERLLHFLLTLLLLLLLLVLLFLLLFLLLLAFLLPPSPLTDI